MCNLKAFVIHSSNKIAVFHKTVLGENCYQNSEFLVTFLKQHTLIKKKPNLLQEDESESSNQQS